MTTPSSLSPPPAAPPLPPLREDLRLLPGAPLVGGGPSWLIYDPTRNRYFQIGEAMFQLLSLWGAGTVPGLLEQARQEFGREVKSAELEQLIKFLSSNALLVEPVNGGRHVLAQMAAAAKHGLLASAVHNYLFFRIPLVRPQAFLERTLHIALAFSSRPALAVYLLLTLLGLFGVSRQWESFLSSFPYFFSFEGGISLALSLAFVKTMHELGHAYSAVRYGARVATMGLAFLVMAPVLYTDVSDSWRLRSRHQRLMIDFAGIAVELTLAGLATFLWVFLPDGPLRSGVFIMASSSWLMSLAVNLNPFMRFDGYYILSDLFGLPNLQSRAFAMGRWALRETLFDPGAPAPEATSRKLRLGLIAYAWSIWLYRLTVFTGIAVLVYYMFFKVLGVILFGVEIGWFVLMPVFSEAREWWTMRRSLRVNGRMLLSAGCALALLLVAAIPWRSGIVAPVVATAKQESRLFAPAPAQIVAIAAQRGQNVVAGEPLVTLRSPALEFELATAQAHLDLVRLRQGRASADRIDRTETQVLAQEFASESAHIEGLRRQVEALAIRAGFDGVVADLDPTLTVGQWINPRMSLGLLIARGPVEARGYVGEDDLARLEPGSEGEFVPDDPARPRFKVKLAEVSYAAVSDIDQLYLASTYGGRVGVAPDGPHKLKPVASQYVVRLEAPDDAALAAAEPGVARIAGKPESFFSKAIKQVLKVIVRETGA